VPECRGAPAPRFGLALHLGEVYCGNIAARSDRFAGSLNRADVRVLRRPHLGRESFFHLRRRRMLAESGRRVS
jgi:hypothetical protein